MTSARDRDRARDFFDRVAHPLYQRHQVDDIEVDGEARSIGLVLKSAVDFWMNELRTG
jgi:hypothetical protein